MTIIQRIVNKSIELLASRPEGLRFSELNRLLQEVLPDIKPNNIPAPQSSPELTLFCSLTKSDPRVAHALRAQRYNFGWNE